MSSDFYFRKWRNTLADLEKIVSTDLEAQESKAHDKTLCEAVHRLNGTLAQYLAVYRDILECIQQNLQVQKTEYMDKIAMAVIARITELKHQLRKLEGSDYRFLSSGLIQHKITTIDVEINDVHPKIERSEEMNALVEDAFKRDVERRRLIEEQKALEEAGLTEEPENKWWEEEKAVDDRDKSETTEPELTEEQIETHRLVSLIKAHEKMRQTTYFFTQQRNKRARWIKELEGTANPPASIEIQKRSAKLIEKAMRKYFEIKRKRILDCKTDEILGIRLCLKPKTEEIDKIHKITEIRKSKRKQYNLERNKEYEILKENFLKLHKDVIVEDYRDFIREWFRQWFDQIQFFNDIPHEREGGLAAILKDETPSPLEWLEEYKQYLADKKANKNKSAIQLKFEKEEAKREAMMLKREAAIKAKLEEQLRRKMMKNPTLHPGYDYPKSKKIENVLKVIKEYHQLWDELDRTESENVKIKYIRTMDYNNICMEVKMELTSAASEDMRKELKLLKTALKKDYENNEEQMPEPMKKKGKKEKKERKQKKHKDENIQDKLDGLISRGFVKEYQKKKLQEFIGDPKFAGDDLRCDYRPSPYSHGETRTAWWEKCRELSLGFQRILLIGPEKTGKTLLVHILASIHDAVLFELDLMSIEKDLIIGEYLNEIINSLVTCARALQPSVIHIKHVQRLFYKKVPPEEAKINFKLIKKYFIKKLFKNINKTDHITIIGTCLEPWTTKSAQLLNQFPNLVLIPDTSYSIIVEFLRNWVISNHTIPPDLDVSSLAYVLKGYSIGFIKQTMTDFITPERIIKIKAFGLSLMDVNDYILEQDSDGKLDYTQYSKWYNEKTPIGQRETKHMKDQKEFKDAIDLYKQRMEKKTKTKHNNNRQKLTEIKESIEE